MSLRSKIIALYLGLALMPMLAVSVVSYIQSIREVEVLVLNKLQAASDQAAAEIRNQHGSLRGSLELLTRAGLGTRDPSSARQVLWRTLSQTFRRAELRDGDGVLVASFESPALAGAACQALVPIRVSRNFAETGESLEVTGWAPSSELLGSSNLGIRFGRTGRTLVVDRETGRLLYEDGCASAAPPSLETVGGGSGDWQALTARGGRLTLVEDEVRYDGSYASIGELPWTVVSAAQMDEFTGPYSRTQMLYLFVVMFVVTAAGGAFVIVAQHFMGSLEDLTVAAERIGEGDLTPWLPPPGEDEVGRLSTAFSRMLERLKATMRQSQAAWQSAAIGGVVSQLSHEIRNPLSSIRLNLQSVEREVKRGSVPADLPDVLGLCMREIERLNDAVSAVLEFGRPQHASRVPCRLNEIVDESLALIRPRLERGRIEVRREGEDARDGILGDAAQLRGVFLNLFLNAADVMPGGGELAVRTETSADGSEVRVRISDTGPGIRPELRDQVFEPFFTTRAEGTGLGLPVAMRAVEANGGRLQLEKRSELDPGAQFVVSLPLAGAAERLSGPVKPAPNPPSMGPRKPGPSGSRSSVVA